MAQYELNLRDYIRILRKRKIVIIVTFVLVLGVSMFYLSGKTIVYKSSTTVKLEERKTIAGLLTEEIMYGSGDEMESAERLIKGYPMMKSLALKLGKINEKSSNEEVSSAVGQVQGGIEAEKIGATNMIRITATAASAREAMELASTMAEVYIEESLLEKAKQARQARQFIEEQLVTSDKRLRKAEESLSRMNEEVKNIKLAEPIQQKLLDLEFQLAELTQKYTEKHPKVIQLKQQIKDMESQLKGFSGQEIEYSRITREIEANKKVYTMLKERLEETRIAEAQKVSGISVVDPAAMGSPVVAGKSIGLMSAMLLGLVLGTGLAFIFESLDTSIGTIEDVENVVKLHVLGVLPPIEREARANKKLFFRIKEQIIPTKKTDEEEKFIRLIAHYKPYSSITEAYRNINTNLKIDPSRKVILVTSSGPREGKSSVVCNLGIVMAQTGLKVLLLSADLRRPVLVKTFGVPKEPGLVEAVMGAAGLDAAIKNITDIMLGEIKFEEILKTPGLENIWILPTGRFVENSVEILESKRLPVLLVELRKRFDVIIIDSPPVLPVADASILAPMADCVVLVYEIGRTSREALIRTKLQLESIGAKICGVILNHTKLQAEAITTYPYAKYGYYNSGGEKKNKDNKSAQSSA